ncbi:MAG: BolA family protein [Janthinobacterium lividum]
MTRIDRIKQTLSVLKPQYLEVIDQTPNHVGHLGQDGSLETHITLKIVSSSFDKMLLIKQHKIINDMLKEEFDSGLHALSIKILKEIPEFQR